MSHSISGLSAKLPPLVPQTCCPHPCSQVAPLEWQQTLFPAAKLIWDKTPKFPSFDSGSWRGCEEAVELPNLSMTTLTQRQPTV